MTLSNITEKDPEKLLEEILEDTETDHPRHRKYIKCRICGNWASLKHCQNKQLSQRDYCSKGHPKLKTVGVKLDMQRPMNPVKTAYLKDIEKLKKSQDYYCSEKCATTGEL